MSKWTNESALIVREADDQLGEWAPALKGPPRRMHEEVCKAR